MEAAIQAGHLQAQRSSQPLYQGFAFDWKQSRLSSTPPDSSQLILCLPKYVFSRIWKSQTRRSLHCLKEDKRKNNLFLRFSPILRYFNEQKSSLCYLLGAKMQKSLISTALKPSNNSHIWCHHLQLPSCKCKCILCAYLRWYIYMRAHVQNY